MIIALPSRENENFFIYTSSFSFVIASESKWSKTFGTKKSYELSENVNRLPKGLVFAFFSFMYHIYEIFNVKKYEKRCH